jgi:hypothetical protein
MCEKETIKEKIKGYSILGLVTIAKCLLIGSFMIRGIILTMKERKNK